MRIRNLLISIFIVLISTQTHADKLYRVTLEGQDGVYTDIISGIVMRASTCMEYLFSEKATLKSNGKYGTLILKNGNQYFVDGFYKKIRLDSGSYRVTVSRKGSDLYEMHSPRGFIKTSMCLELALMDDAILKSDGFGGELIFKSEKCDCKSIYVETSIR